MNHPVHNSQGVRPEVALEIIDRHGSDNVYMPEDFALFPSRIVVVPVALDFVGTDAGTPPTYRGMTRRAGIYRVRRGPRRHVYRDGGSELVTDRTLPPDSFVWWDGRSVDKDGDVAVAWALQQVQNAGWMEMPSHMNYWVRSEDLIFYGAAPRDKDRTDEWMRVHRDLVRAFSLPEAPEAPETPEAPDDVISRAEFDVVQMERDAFRDERNKAYDMIHRIQERLEAEAEAREWCSEYDEIMQEIGLQPRRSPFEVQTIVTLKVKVPLRVSARNMRDALAQVTDVAPSAVVHLINDQLEDGRRIVTEEILEYQPLSDVPHAQIVRRVD